LFIAYFTDEGRKKIFHRDEIKKFNANRPEEKTNAEFGANNKNGNSNSNSQDSKLNNIKNDQQHKQQHSGRSSSPQDKVHSGRNNSHSAPPVQDRLGQQGWL
jgi:hypothetical protein